jgi:hypothetical protein
VYLLRTQVRRALLAAAIPPGPERPGFSRRTK